MIEARADAGRRPIGLTAVEGWRRIILKTELDGLCRCLARKLCGDQVSACRPRGQ